VDINTAPTTVFAPHTTAEERVAWLAARCGALL